ncbi:MAG: TetR/AcrR family transcriptional regulator [Deltaproteobacteria bacterium]|nr:TetR/AcrR family transcriptional regulator [Deltaproteobacteria bacterium]
MTGDERKVQILEHAAEICARKGFSGTTLDEIAKAAGVSRALVVQHFGSKEKLYGELIDFLFRGRVPALGETVAERMAAGDDAGVFFAFFDEVMTLMTEKTETSPLRLIIFSMLEQSEIYRRHYEKRFVGNTRILEEYLERRMAAGDLRRVDSHRVVIAFISTMIQLVFQHLTFPDLFPRREVEATMRTSIELMTGGLKKGVI